MNLGQVTTIIEFDVTYHTDLTGNDNFDIKEHLNEMGKGGWYLHTITHFPKYDSDGYETSTTYRCIWQKITQNVGGLLSR